MAWQVCNLNKIISISKYRTGWHVNIEATLKLNTIQLVTPGGNHCCLMANDVQN